MPVYNAERYVGKAVESILSQSCTDFEFIIINDGSKDSTLDILTKYANQDARIQLVSRENRGLVKTLNEGVALAKAPLIARMDADDIALPDRFLLQKQFMLGNPEVLCVGGRVKVIDGKGRFLINTDPKIGHDAIERSALQGVSPITHPSVMLRKAALEKVGGYHESDYPAEDLALWLNLSAIGKIANIPEVILEYRIHDNSISTGEHDKQMQKTREICEAACRSRGVALDFQALEGRPTKSRLSKFNTYLRHGWWAFSSKQWDTAFIYALKALRWSPFNSDGWRLLFCSLLKDNDG